MSADWRMAAACREDDAELFFPTGSHAAAQAQTEEAKAVCRRCPVMEQCLAWALETRQEYGIWGALDERQRANLRRRQARRASAEPRRGKRHGGGRPLAPCGTDTAYRRHIDRGEPIDNLCTQAHDDTKARRRRAKWATSAGAA